MGRQKGLLEAGGDSGLTPQERGTSRLPTPSVFVNSIFKKALVTLLHFIHVLLYLLFIVNSFEVFKLLSHPDLI